MSRIDTLYQLTQEILQQARTRRILNWQPHPISSFEPASLEQAQLWHALTEMAQERIRVALRRRGLVAVERVASLLAEVWAEMARLGHGVDYLVWLEKTTRGSLGLENEPWMIGYRSRSQALFKDKVEEVPLVSGKLISLADRRVSGETVAPLAIQEGGA